MSGAEVIESLLFHDVTVDERSRLYRSVVLPHVEIGRGCRISRAIIDENCIVPDDLTIGEDPEEDAKWFHVTSNGVTLVTTEMLERLEQSQPDQADDSKIA